MAAKANPAVGAQMQAQRQMAMPQHQHLSMAMARGRVQKDSADEKSSWKDYVTPKNAVLAFLGITTVAHLSDKEHAVALKDHAVSKAQDFPKNVVDAAVGKAVGDTANLVYCDKPVLQ